MSKTDEWSQQGYDIAEEFSRTMNNPAFRFKVYVKFAFLLILLIVLIVLVLS